MINEIASLPDVSFIDNKTLDKVQADMVAFYKAKYKEITGKDLQLRRADPETLKLYAASVILYQIFLAVDKGGKMDLLKYAYGAFLDHCGAFIGLTRLPAYPAVLTERFTLSEALGFAVTIPQGTRVSNGDQIYFQTDETAEIGIGETYVDIPCTCLTDGVGGNGIIPGAVNTLVDPIPYVASVANLEETSGGADIESDEDFAYRIYLAPSGYSVAGPTDAYVYHTKSCSSAIGEVEVTSPEPCEIEVRFLLNDGSMPPDSLLAEVKEYLSERTLRPLSDRVSVMRPTGQSFNLSFTYYINRTDAEKAVTIQAEVNSAVEEYIAWQTSKIGRDINPSVLTQKVMAAGAKRVDVISPAFMTVPKGSVARIGTQTITYGGVEDD